VYFEVKHGGFTMSDKSEEEAKLLIILPTATKHDVLLADPESTRTPLPSLSSSNPKLFPDISSQSFIWVQGFK